MMMRERQSFRVMWERPKALQVAVAVALAGEAESASDWTDAGSIANNVALSQSVKPVSATTENSR